MKDEIVLFLSQYILIFIIGFQSQSVRDNRYGAAMLGSVFIGLAQLFQWKVMPNATPSQMIVWLLAGPLGIVSSMWLHPIIFRKRRVDKSK
jgi:hypothetical protein